ncbi:ABC transporter permease [Peptoniphilus sp. ING2-D1G]|nr:ABC transporter permease [Peptoniphilus sp. ING2-D1G]
MKACTTSNKDNKKRTVLAIAILILLWQLAALIFPVKFLIATPLQVVRKLSELLGEIDFWQRIAYSCFRILTGLVLAIVLGVLCAMVSLKRKFLREIINQFSNLLKSTPVIVIAIVLLIIFSDNSVTAVVVLMACFPVIYINFLEGLDNTDVKMLELAKVYDFTEYKKWKYIRFRSAKSHLKSAVLITSGMAWKAGIAAEVMGLPDKSIGEAIYSSKIFLYTEEIFAYALVIILLSKVTEKLMIFIFDTFYLVFMESKND